MKCDAVVTIDGPVASGKSTVGRLLAARIGAVYLDTGAMYRVVALAADRDGKDTADESAMVNVCRSVAISFQSDGKRQQVFDGSRNVTEQIREPRISMLASAISALPGVRRELVALQRSMGRAGGVVVDGRDAGTVIFPAAQHKFYLDADIVTRAVRRHKELLEKGLEVDYNETFNDIKRRDLNDSSRAVAPLKPAADAVIIDTTRMTIEDVLQSMVRTIQCKTASKL